MNKKIRTKREVEAIKLENELASFTGSMLRYQHQLNQAVIYTPGVRHLANKAEAYWLVDAIASWIGTRVFCEASRKDPRIKSMHFWKLNRSEEDDSAVLIAQADSDVEPFIVQSIAFTDFPMKEIAIWAAFDGAHWTLYLPSEH